MRTEQQKPQPRSNQTPKSIGGDEECTPLLKYFMPFPVTTVHRKAEEGEPEMTGSDEPQVHLCSSGESLQPSDPCSSQAATPDAHSCGTDVFAPSQLPQELSVLRALPGLLQSLEAELCYGSTCTSTPITVSVFKGAQIRLFLKF